MKLREIMDILHTCPSVRVIKVVEDNPDEFMWRVVLNSTNVTLWRFSTYESAKDFCTNANLEVIENE